MRRKQQQLDEETSMEILRKATSGVLSLLGADGYPYGVPMSFAMEGNKIFFHCATEGQKLDAIRNCGKASFCVVERDDVIADKLTTAYRSVIVRGNIEEEKDDERRKEALWLLARKYSPDMQNDQVESEIKGAWSHVVILVLSIVDMTGKQGKELVKH